MQHIRDHPIPNSIAAPVSMSSRASADRLYYVFLMNNIRRRQLTQYLANMLSQISI